MKDQASLNLLIVDSPIDNKALENHLMLRATSDGLKLYDNTGAETPLGGGTVDLSNYTTSKIKLTSSDGAVQLITGNGYGSIQLIVTDTNNPERATFKTPGVWDIQMGSYLTKITGTQQMDIEAEGSACPVKITAGANGGDIELNASGSIKFNGAALNTANGLVQLGSNGKLPTSLYEAGGNTDLSSYTGFVDITGKNGDSTIHAADGNLVLSSDSNVVLGGVYVASQSDFFAPSVSSENGDLVLMTSNESDAIVLAPGSFGSNPEDSRSGTIKIYADSVLFNGSAYNTANGFAIIGNDGKLPSSILPESTGSSVDLSAYTGGINLNSTNDSAVAIKFNSGNPTYNAALTMDAAGVTLSGYGDVKLSHTGGSYLWLTSGEAALSSNSSLMLTASSRLTINATEGIYLGAAGLNTAGGLVKLGDDGKIPSSLYEAGSAGATPQLMFTVPSNASGLHLEITAGKLADGTDNAALINTATSADHRAKVLGNSGGTDWIACPDTGFGTNFAGWPVKVDVTGLLDPSEISYIRYRWVPTSGDPSDWYAMVYPCATEAPIPSSGGSGGDTTELDNRVTALESTVGSLDAAVDEILADYGEGSGALVYRVVASATEPENPTEGMIWIQTA